MFKKLLLALLISISLLFSGCIDSSATTESNDIETPTTPQEQSVESKMIVWGTPDDFDYYKLPLSLHKSDLEGAEKVIIKTINGAEIYYLEDYTGEKTEVEEFNSEYVDTIYIYYSETHMFTCPNNDNKNIPILPLGIYESDPDSVYDFYMEEAYSYYDEGNYERADVYARAATYYKPNVESYTLRADCMRKLGDYEAQAYFQNKADDLPLTFAEFERTYTKNMNIPDDAKDYEELGDKYEKTNPEKAIEYYEQSVRIFDGNACVWHKLAGCYYDVGDYDLNAYANGMIFELDPDFYSDFPLIFERP
jgi:tetratricopeptide (TPR) repeat protein